MRLRWRQVDIAGGRGWNGKSWTNGNWRSRAYVRSPKPALAQLGDRSLEQGLKDLGRDLNRGSVALGQTSLEFALFACEVDAGFRSTDVSSAPGSLAGGI